MITVLAGGVGAAKFLEGLVAVMPPNQITAIVNTGDDVQFHGLHVSPDIDTVIYTLASVVNREQGWGLAGDTFNCLEALHHLGAETWFRLGDRDLATHLWRTRRLQEGASLSAVTEELRRTFGVACRILPMSDHPAPTRLRTTAGVLAFQEYFVKLRQEPDVLEADFSAAAASPPAPEVLESLRQAHGIILAPSNPILSISPILAVPGVRKVLQTTAAPVAAISPIVGGRALKGPADRNLQSLGLGASATAVAELYRDFVDIFIMDSQDASQRTEVEQQGLQTVVTQTIMNLPTVAQKLARTTLTALENS